MKARGINLLDLNLPLRDPEVGEPSIVAAHKGDTKMTETPSETEGPIVLADADRVEKLLDIIRNTVDMPNVPCIRAAAQNELAQIEHDLWEQMYPEQAEAEEARVKAEEEAEAARKARLEEQTEEEKEALAPAPQPRDTLATQPAGRF